MPFFSVIIPSYNRAHLIAATIRSVLSQSFIDWELILIDDGSSDNTKEVVESFADSRIKYFYQENAERCVARNNGITQAAGQFICFLDSDDIWLPEHLQTLYRALEENKFMRAVYFTAMCWCFDNGKRQNVVFDSPQHQNRIEYVIKNQIAPSTQCISKEILVQHKFNAALRINEDVELNARIVNEYPLIQIPKVTVEMIVHNENTKALEKDYISPQLKAMKIIFSNPVLKNKISSSFKRYRMAKLEHLLINYYLETKQFSKMNKAIVWFLICYPNQVLNKSKVILLLYHMPGGRIVELAVKCLKMKKR